MIGLNRTTSHTFSFLSCKSISSRYLRCFSLPLALIQLRNRIFYRVTLQNPEREQATAEGKTGGRRARLIKSPPPHHHHLDGWLGRGRGEGRMQAAELAHTSDLRMMELNPSSSAALKQRPVSSPCPLLLAPLVLVVLHPPLCELLSSTPASIF